MNNDRSSLAIEKTKAVGILGLAAVRFFFLAPPTGLRHAGLDAPSDD